MKYKWLKKDPEEIEQEFIEACQGSEIIARLLLNRGITSTEKATQYLNPQRYIESIPEEIPQLDIAKERILKAIKNNEIITIFGDYDVDGVTSTSCLLTTLLEFTDNVNFYIPSRHTEGYGLNENAVKKFAKDKTNLLITCDCGVTNHKETDLANSLGIDVIITDHHSLPENLPNAVAVLNPKLLPENHKLHQLPGVGVAYKLAESILAEIPTLNSQCTMKKEDLHDLVTLGMIADLASLVDENRYLVQIGLDRLANTKRIGLRELLRVCGCLPEQKGSKSSVNAEHVGFGIAPRINAVGRLTDANLAVKLMTTDNEIEALHLACELDVQNKQRQSICEETFKEAKEMAAGILNSNPQLKSLVLASDTWHHGIVGIVASRIVEKYHLPTILIAIDKEGNIAKGSGRSIEGFNLLEAVNMSSDSLEKHGGHKAACGLSVKPENVERFIEDFSLSSNKLLEDRDISPTLKIDMGIDLNDLNLGLMEKINMLSPFGLGNRMPIFECNEVEISTLKPIGKEGKHLKLLLKDKKSQRFFEALIWNYTERGGDLRAKDKVDLAFTPKLNHFYGEPSLQLEIKDWNTISIEAKTPTLSSCVKPASKNPEFIDCRKDPTLINELSSDSTSHFAETKQKDFLPLKTFSRHKLELNETLVLLECPPDKSTLQEIINKVQPKKIFLSFSNSQYINSESLIKRLLGMLKYVINNKNGAIKKEDLEVALGVNRSTLTFALETLSKSGLIEMKQSIKELNIKLGTPNREDFTNLIEYNLFKGEVTKINEFYESMDTTNVISNLIGNPSSGYPLSRV